MFGMKWLKNVITKVVVEVISNTTVEMEMVDGKPVYKVKVHKEI